MIEIILAILIYLFVLFSDKLSNGSLHNLLYFLTLCCIFMLLGFFFSVMDSIFIKDLPDTEKESIITN